ncbi:MAG: hypothetical protein IJF24_04810 [Clostridia bacterium]|nr:hypothetical protein [Clostridia bacterium]
MKRFNAKQKGVTAFSFLALVLLVLILIFCLPKENVPVRFGAPMRVEAEDGTVLSASPSAMTLCEDGSVLVCDSALHVIWRVSATEAKIVAGRVGTPDATGRVSGGYVDGAAKDARFDTPTEILPYGKGYLISDSLNHVLRYFDPEQKTVVTFAGTGKSGMTDGVVDCASFASPAGMCTDEAGNLYVADTLNHAIRKIDTAGYVSTFLGGKSGFFDGSFDVARLSYPVDIVCRGQEFYIADRKNAAVRAVISGELVTLCGADPTDLNGAEETAFSPESLFVTEDGALLICDSARGSILEFSGGVLSTRLAEQANASMRLPVDLIFSDGDLYLASATSCELEVLHG